MSCRPLRVLAMLAIAAGCSGGNGGGGGGPNSSTVLAKASNSGDGQAGTVGAALGSPFCARVTENGTAKSGATVTWSTASGGSIAPVNSTTAGDGIACATLTLGQTAGPQSAQAASAGATGSPLTFNATANAGQAANMAKGGGDNQTGFINNSPQEPLSVIITDQFGNPVSGVNVGWSVSMGSASLDPATAPANGSGVSSTIVTFGGTAGPVEIMATAGALNGSPQTFNLTANNPPPAPSAITISVQNSVFVPAVDTVAAGGTVTWTWAAAAMTHSVTSTGSPSFTSDPAGITSAPHTYGPITFNTPGTYFYYCEVHGSPGSPPSGMSGTIVVQ